MNENIKVLDDIYKGAEMGKSAIYNILDKINDESLKSEVEYEKDCYEAIINEIEKIYPKYNDDKPKEASPVTKVFSWAGIEFKTLTDKSNSKIAELLLNGFNMGVIDGRKMLNNNLIESDINNIVDSYINMQEKAIERLKKFL